MTTEAEVQAMIDEVSSADVQDMIDAANDAIIATQDRIIDTQAKLIKELQEALDAAYPTS